MCASFLTGITEPDALARQNLDPALTPTSSLSGVQCKDNRQVTDSVMSVILVSELNEHFALNDA